METQVSVWTCDNSHINSLIKLGSTYYSTGSPALSEEFIRWFYIDNPEGPATLVIAHEGDEWIGMMVMIPVKLELNGQTQKACFAINALSHPEHRTKNLFIKIIKATVEYLTAQNVWLIAHPSASSMPGWKRQKMMFRDPLLPYLAKFNMPFFGTNVRRLHSLEELMALPASLWSSLSNRSDGHLKYTPEFIAWRYLNAVHRKYVVSVVEKSGEVLGLRVTRPFKWSFDLMVDYAASEANLAKVLASVYKPTLVMHPGLGDIAQVVKNGAWKFPYKRIIYPFFVTSLGSPNQTADMNGITFGASDF